MSELYFESVSDKELLKNYLTNDQIKLLDQFVEKSQDIFYLVATPDDQIVLDQIGGYLSVDNNQTWTRWEIAVNFSSGAVSLTDLGLYGADSVDGDGELIPCNELPAIIQSLNNNVDELKKMIPTLQFQTVTALDYAINWHDINYVEHLLRLDQSITEDQIREAINRWTDKRPDTAQFLESYLERRFLLGVVVTPDQSDQAGIIL